MSGSNGVSLQDRLKKEAGISAVDFIQSGMVLGLGTGSTVRFALEEIGKRYKDGRLTDIVGIPSSIDTDKRAKELGIPIITFDEKQEIDLTIDGADEIDPDFNLIKGGGGALLREKLVAQESEREVIIADESKLSPELGTNFKLPIEVMPFGWERQVVFVHSLGGKAIARKRDNDEFALSDQGNYLLDCDFGVIEDAAALATQLEGRAGIVEHGLFLGLATDVIVAGADGTKHHSIKSG